MLKDNICRQINAVGKKTDMAYFIVYHVFVFLILKFGIVFQSTTQISYYCFPAFSAQTYVGRKRAAVDRICVGVPAGEVKSQSSFILRATTAFLKMLRDADNKQ